MPRCAPGAGSNDKNRETPGQPIQQTYDEAARVMQAVADAGVDLDDVFKVLEDEGIHKFTGSWDELTESVRSEPEDKK